MGTLISLLEVFPVFSRCRGSCPEVFCEKGVLKDFAIFIGGSLLNKLAGLKTYSTLLKKDSSAGVFL